jgi:hypothetical protein
VPLHAALQLPTWKQVPLAACRLSLAAAAAAALPALLLVLEQPPQQLLHYPHRLLLQQQCYLWLAAAFEHTVLLA